MSGKGNRFSEHSDERLAVLFLPFREKSLNPTSWAQKMKYWTNVIIDDALQRYDSVVNIEDLASRFELDGKEPQCLNTVIKELVQNGKVFSVSVDYDDTLIPTTPYKDWLTWGYWKFIKSPVSWGKKLLNKKNSEVRYVVTDILKDKCRRLIDRHYCEALCDITDSMVEFTKLLDRNRDICKSDLEFYLIIEQLVKEKKVIVHKEKSHIMVKFCCKTDKEVKPIQQSDLHVFRVKVVADALKSRIEKLSENIGRLTEEARTRKEMNETRQALHSLRKRRVVIKRQCQLSASLDLLEEILENLRQAVSNEMVLKAIQLGTSVLKEYTSRINLHHVSSSMQQLTEVMEQHSDVNDILHSELCDVSFRMDDATEDEFEKELSDLLSENGESDYICDELEDLTDVLDTTASSSLLGKLKEPYEGQVELDEPCESNEVIVVEDEDSETCGEILSENDGSNESINSKSKTPSFEDLIEKMPDVPAESVEVYLESKENDNNSNGSMSVELAVTNSRVTMLNISRNPQLCIESSEVKEQDLEESWHHTMKSKRRRTLILYKPPVGLTFEGTFTEAQEAGRDQSKWLLVNVQNVKEYVCQVQNRDLWSDTLVQQIIRQHFIFWQIQHDSEEGINFTQLYDIKTWPYINIIDPRDGKILNIWNETKVTTFHEDVEKFLTENKFTCDYSDDESPPNKKLKMELITEGEQNLLPSVISEDMSTVNTANSTGYCVTDREDESLTIKYNQSTESTGMESNSSQEEVVTAIVSGD